MRIAIIIVRSLLGVLFVFGAVVFLFKVPMEQPPMTEGVKTFMTFFHAFLDEPKNLPTAILVLAANLFLAYAYRKNYVGLLAMNPSN